MSITAQNLAYLGNGTNAALATGGAPAVLAFGGSDAVELAYKGVVTFTLDGSATTATLNYVDGTSAIPFTPSGFIFSKCGGTASVYPINVVDAANSNKTATVTFSGAGSNAQTVIMAVMILK